MVVKQEPKKVPMPEKVLRNRKTKMYYGVAFKCGCTLGRIEGTYQDGNPWDIHDDFTCLEHGETYAIRTWGRGQ